MAKIVIKNNSFEKSSDMVTTGVFEKHAERIWKTSNPEEIHIVVDFKTYGFSKILEEIERCRKANDFKVDIIFDKGERKNCNSFKTL